ncbi:MAG: protein kinase [Planctomycetota bacterium]
MEPDAEHHDGDTALEQVLDRYLRELADGLEPDQEQYLAEHPHLAKALKGVFRTLDFVEATSRTLHASRLETGQRLGEYRILREVGRGGMGVVYEAVQEKLDRRVALKVLATDSLLSRTAEERFSREANTAAHLHHHNIVPVYAVGEDQGIHYYAMQYIDGHSLEGHLQERRKQGAISEKGDFLRVAGWGHQVAEALAHAHDSQVIHRDIKPSNLLLDAQDDVWITDFGLARAAVHPTITISGDVIGTARYMSPEQARGGGSRLDERTDIYSLGTTLYELIAMRPAFDGETRDSILRQIAAGETPSLKERAPQVPRDLQTIVEKCMEQEPDARYLSARELAEDLRRFLAGESILARRTPLIVRCGRFVSKHRPHTLAALLLLVMLAAFIYRTVQERKTRANQLVEDAFTELLFERKGSLARTRLEAAGALGADSARYRLCRGLIPLLDGRNNEAIAYLEEALRQAPSDQAACYALALAHSLNTDFVRAQLIMDQTTGKEPESALAWLLRGEVLGRVQGSAAIDALSRAIQLRPDFTLALENRGLHRGNQLLNQGDRSQLQAMLDDTNALVILRPEDPSSYLHRARGWLSAAIYAGTQDDLPGQEALWLENCRQDLERAGALEKTENLGLAILEGTYWRYSGKLDLSEERFAAALAIGRKGPAGQDAYLLFELAITQHARGEIQKALETSGGAEDSLLEYYPMVLLRSVLLAESGRLEEARECCGSHLGALAGNATALFMAVAGLELLGDRPAAAGAIEEFVARRGERIVSEHANPDVIDLPLRYLANEIEASALLSSAADSPGNRCEFAFYIALRELGRGQREAGIAALKTCLKTGVFHFGEYRFAQAFLRRVESQPDWPSWAAAKTADPADGHR